MSDFVAEGVATAMIAPRLDRPAALAPWREAARALLAAGIPPEDVAWEGGLLAGEPIPEPIGAEARRVPRAFLDLAEFVLRHRAPGRHALLYRALWRLTHGEPALLCASADADVERLEAMARAVRRDAHRMHAYVRFRRLEEAAGGGERYLAWHAPEHLILEAEAPFFVQRFAQLDWSIVTPDGSAHWDGEALAFGPPGRRADAPAEAAAEELWRAYDRALLDACGLRQPLPQARRRALVAGDTAAAPAARPAHRAAPPRVGGSTMPDDLFTHTEDRPAALAALRRELEADAYRDTTLVFGEGRLGAALLFIGEQPGDEEDRQARPFVGPAGRLFDRALQEVGIPREETYVTNAVKRFKYVMQGSRRLHQTPDAGDIKHYRPFLLREVELVAPRLVVTLGATALKAMTGKASLAVTKVRGELLQGAGERPLFPTVHPSYLLRLPDEESKRREWARFVEDLKRVRREIA